MQMMPSTGLRMAYAAGVATSITYFCMSMPNAHIGVMIDLELVSFM